MLTAEELLAGGALTFDVDVPADLLHPTLPGEPGGHGEDDGQPPPPGRVRLRPLTVADLQLVSRAAQDAGTLLGALMVQRALVEPVLTVAEVVAAPVGLVEYLLDRVNAISGISTSRDDLRTAAEAPLVRAAATLSREFGWTPEQVSELTLGQVLLHLELLAEPKRS
jgi:hypothetical protein